MLKVFTISALVCLVFADCPAGFYGPKCDVEEKCAHPTGLDCSFYSDCLEAKTKCDITENVCLPKCRDYQTLEPSLSAVGQTWTKYVRKCLEERVATDVLMQYGNDFPCEAVSNAFFHDHLPCYVDGPLSFCKLPLADSTRVLWTAKDIFWKGYIHEATEAGVKLLSACGMQAFTLTPEDPTVFAEFMNMADAAANANPHNLNAAPSTESTLQVSLAQLESQLNQYLRFVGFEASVLLIDNNIVTSFRAIPGAMLSIHMDLETLRGMLSKAMAALFGSDNTPKMMINLSTITAEAPFDHSGLMLVAGVVACVAVVAIAVVGAVVRRRQQRRNRMLEQSLVF